MDFTLLPFFESDLGGLGPIPFSAAAIQVRNLKVGLGPFCCSARNLCFSLDRSGPSDIYSAREPSLMESSGYSVCYSSGLQQGDAAHASLLNRSTPEIPKI